MEVRFLRQPFKYIRKADKGLKEKIQEEIQVIKNNPKVGKLLKGKLKSIRAHKFALSKTNYRIAYSVENNILVIYIASRENFYKDLEQ